MTLLTYPYPGAIEPVEFDWRPIDDVSGNPTSGLVAAGDIWNACVVPCSESGEKWATIVNWYPPYERGYPGGFAPYANDRWGGRDEAIAAAEFAVRQLHNHPYARIAPPERLGLYDPGSVPTPAHVDGAAGRSHDGPCYSVYCRLPRHDADGKQIH